MSGMNFDVPTSRRVDPSRRNAAASDNETMDLIILNHRQFEIVIERGFYNDNLLPIVSVHMEVSGDRSPLIGLRCAHVLQR